MPMPRWWGRIHGRVAGTRAVLTHVGRSSGMPYRTPVGAHPVEGGYLVRGPGSDWVRNVVAAGRAQLAVDGEDVDLTAPRVVGEAEACAALGVKALRVAGFVRMDVAR
ncbi:nitroreductase family deazaflavin-dependent oxidoreductase [Lentzea albida]|uniref:Deazaflavin-dependent oxidoreductase, nitroreductase family n=1 Tax=Lentzea albida TaxID=65499 RepID=A0A1H9S8V6_9PSEU|nr:nitroreductase family deazaflavin-dependent oxidoreductase [Lentzea albida]SER81442.1 deazaflavin-dependent oxidoreductase, nitroreductase family [Lentzea albida]